MVKKYEVTVFRTIEAWISIEVIAPDEDTAIEKADGLAGAKEIYKWDWTTSHQEEQVELIEEYDDE